MLGHHYPDYKGLFTSVDYLTYKDGKMYHLREHAVDDSIKIGLAGRKGVLDLLIFPLISRRLVSLFEFYSRSKSLMAQCLWVVLAIPAFPLIAVLEFARYALATLLTIALLPVISIVQFAGYIRGRILEDRARGLEVLGGLNIPLLIAKITLYIRV